MFWHFCLRMTLLYPLLVPKRTSISCEVQFVKAEIKRNNITLPNIVNTAFPNATNVGNTKIISADKDKAKTGKGEKKSEVYVVNNGLLLLHPQKVITSLGVKKSTEPVPPPSINYHVIRKVKNNATDTNLAANILENHMKKRSLSIRFQPRRKKKSKRHHHPGVEIGAKRLGIPNVSHGRIISVNKNDRFGKKSHKVLSFFNHNRNRPYKGRTTIAKYSNTFQNIRDQNEKRAGIESPLFDSDQVEYLKSARYKMSEREQQAERRSKKAASRGIDSIKKIPDIRKYFEKPLDIKEYPRFAVKPFPGRGFPRFPISPSALATYPRFPVNPQDTQILHRFPVYPAPLQKYPRYPYINPVAEFPRFENGLKRYTEHPRFEEIKPLDLEEYPRFAEPTPIPEIKEIENADKRGKSKRAEIFHRVKDSYDDHATHQFINEDDGDGEDEGDSDYDEEDNVYGRAIESQAGYPLISPIGSISHIASPPGIPEIADIPFLPEIPSLHGIHGIKPISSIKSIPQSDKTGTSRTLPTEAKDIAKIQSNNVSIKDLSKDPKTA